MKKSLLGIGLLCAATHASADYRKATEGRDVVMSKLYPKSERFELGLPAVGFVMNQSYVSTILLGADASYFLNETLGFSFVMNTAMNQDKAERTCIENFYYDPSNEVGVACGKDNLKAADKNNDQFPRFGPAYVPIREIQQILIANAIWTPVYGKQLFSLGGTTSYFDLFLELGVGMAQSKFYKKLEVLKNGNLPRGVYMDPTAPGNDPAEAAANNDKIGALPDTPQFYGKAGRPPVREGSNPLLNLGLGQKFHFGHMFHVKIYVRNMTLLATDQGFENLFAIYGGIGLRF